MLVVDDTVKAIAVALIFTLLIVIIEVASQSKARMRACFSWLFLLYLAILALGNSVTTLLASIAVAGRLPALLNPWLPLFYAFFGVFAFEGVLGNTNVTIFDRGVLTIQDWIAKARDRAIASAVANNVRMATNLANQAARELRKLPNAELNTYIDRKFGAGTAAKLETDARKGGSDPQLYKALELATNAPDETAAILKANAKAKTQAKNREPVEEYHAPNDKLAATFVILAATGAVAIALLTHYGMETLLVWTSFFTGVCLIVSIHLHWRSRPVKVVCLSAGLLLLFGCLVWQYRLSFPEQEAVLSTVSTPAPSPTKATASPTPVAVQEERILLDVKPEYLVGFFKKYTTAQAEKLVETYIGKWVKISGTVKDVDRRLTLNDKPGDPTVDISTKSSEGSFGTAAYFEEQRWKDRALVLKPGDKITVFGRITRITWWGLTLEKGEFVE